MAGGWLKAAPEGIKSTFGHHLSLKGAAEQEILAPNGRQVKVEVVLTEAEHFGALLGTRALDALHPGLCDLFCNCIDGLEEVRGKICISINLQVGLNKRLQ